MTPSGSSGGGLGLGLGLAGGLAAAASRPAAPEPMYTPKQEPSYAYNPPPPAPPPPPPAPPPPPPEPQSAPVPPPPPITAPTPQPAPIFTPPQPPQEYEFMQNGFNVDDTPAYIQVPKGAAGNAAVQLPQEPAYTPPPETDYFAQQFAPDVFSPTPEPAYGGYGLDRDDRYYEQMFAKGGIVNLLRRHMRKYQ